MIRRKTTQAVAQAYQEVFRGSYYYRGGMGTAGYRYKMNQNELHDFLYENDFDAWFLQLVKSLRQFEVRSLLEFIMGLHTGTSIMLATKDWAWEQRTQLGQRLIAKLAECIVVLAKSHGSKLESGANMAVSRLLSELELDGYTFRDNRLYHSEVGVLDADSEINLILKLAHDASLANQNVIEHHLELSETHYTQGNWDDSISNSRKFLESVLQEIAARHHSARHGGPLSSDTHSRPVEVRRYLQREGIVSQTEMETIARIYGLLSETGGHPYIAEKDQARLTRYLALIVAQFILLKLEAFLSSRHP